MAQKQDALYQNLQNYAEELHQKNKKRIRASGIVLLLLPVILGLVRWLTDSDKIVFLLIWVLCMFLLSAYLVSVEYLDHTLQKKLFEMTGRVEDYDGLLDRPEDLPSKIKEHIKSRLDTETGDDAEEGGDA